MNKGRFITYSILFITVCFVFYLYSRQTAEKPETHTPDVDRQSTVELPVDISEEPVINESDNENIALFNKAVGLFNEKDFESAIPLFESLVDFDYKALQVLGISYFMTEEYEKAIASLEKVLEVDGNDFLSMKYLSLSFYRIGDMDSSNFYAVSALAVKEDSDLIKLLEITDNIKRENASVFTSEPDTGRHRVKEVLREGYNRMNDGDYNGAMYVFKKIEGESTDAVIGLGICHLKLGFYNAAIDYFANVLADNSENFIANKYAAIAYYKTDDIDKSLSHVEAALAVKDDRELHTLYDKLKRESVAHKGFIEVSTLHFTLIYDGAEHRSAGRMVIDILEDAYRTIGKELDFFPDVPLSVILYSDRKFYSATETPEWTRGLYDGKIRIPIKDIERVSKRSIRKTIFHEYTHAVIHKMTPYCPQWLNEGLAEYLSKSDRKKTGQVIPLTDLEGSFFNLPKNKISLAYMESYSAVTYLVEKYGMYRIRRLLESLSQSRSLNQAFRDAFYISYDDFVNQWGRD